MSRSNLKQKSFSKPVTPSKPSIPHVTINSFNKTNSAPNIPKPSKTVGVVNQTTGSTSTMDISERIDNIICLIWFIGSALGLTCFWYNKMGGFDFSVIFVIVFMTIGSFGGFVTGISGRDGIILKYIPGVLYAAGGLALSFVAAVVILIPIYIVGGILGWWSL